MTRVYFNNMNTNIYGDWVLSSGITSFTREDLARAIINHSSDVIVITVDGQKHFVQYSQKLAEFLK